MTNTYCVYTVLRYSWWWTVDTSETCRVLYQINLRNSGSRWLFHYKTVGRNDIAQSKYASNSSKLYVGHVKALSSGTKNSFSPFYKHQKKKKLWHPFTIRILRHFRNFAVQYTAINPLTPNPIYGSYRTANLQTLHFTYLFNKCRYWIF